MAGKGLKRLKQAGLEVALADPDGACEAVNAPFFTWVAQHRPYVILKAAATLDGRIATRSGDSRWITGNAARELGHQWRDRADAILVGAGTVRADDPRLTTRLPGVTGRDPVRVVLDGRLTTDPAAKIYGLRSQAPTLLAVPSRTSEAKVAPYARRPRTEVLRVAGARGRVDLEALLAELARREIMTLLVEGGGEVHGALLAAGLVDEVRLFLAPTLVGEGPSWLSLPEGTGPARLADAWKLGPRSRRAGGGRRPPHGAARALVFRPWPRTSHGRRRRSSGRSSVSRSTSARTPRLGTAAGARRRPASAATSASASGPCAGACGCWSSTWSRRRGPSSTPSSPTTG